MFLSYVYGLMEHALQAFWVNSGYGKSDMPEGKRSDATFKIMLLLITVH